MGKTLCVPCLLRWLGVMPSWIYAEDFTPYPMCQLAPGIATGPSGHSVSRLLNISLNGTFNSILDSKVHLIPTFSTRSLRSLLASDIVPLTLEASIDDLDFVNGDLKVKGVGESRSKEFKKFIHKTLSVLSSLPANLKFGSPPLSSSQRPTPCLLAYLPQWSIQTSPFSVTTLG